MFHHLGGRVVVEHYLLRWFRAQRVRVGPEIVPMRRALIDEAPEPTLLLEDAFVVATRGDLVLLLSGVGEKIVL